MFSQSVQSEYRYAQFLEHSLFPIQTTTKKIEFQIPGKCKCAKMRQKFLRFFRGRKTNKLHSRPNVFSSYIFNYLSRLKSHFWSLSFSLNEMRCIFSDSVTIHFFPKNFTSLETVYSLESSPIPVIRYPTVAREKKMLKGLFEKKF